MAGVSEWSDPEMPSASDDVVRDRSTGRRKRASVLGWFVGKARTKARRVPKKKKKKDRRIEGIEEERSPVRQANRWRGLSWPDAR